MAVPGDRSPDAPVVLSTWSFGAVANAAAWPVLAAGGDALDAAVAGATAVEDDPSVDSVGLAGLPDASGRVSLDAAVMRSPRQAGTVCYLRGFAHAAQIARAVMEKSIHMTLAGDGAEAFAARHGFARRDAAALSPSSQTQFAEWQRRRAGAPALLREGALPPMNVEERYRAAGGRPEPSHDTVCVLARDRAGRLAGAVTTSGLAFKVPGRVGDSPIIGAGLYVEQGEGAAAATGTGELVMGVCGSFLAVELLRAGRTPVEAAVGVLERIIAGGPLLPDHQVALIVLGADGRWASAALRPGFTHCVTDEKGMRREGAGRVVVGE